MRTQRLGTDRGHKMDFLVREERVQHQARDVPPEFQTGGTPDETPTRVGARYGRGPNARGLRRRGVKRAQRKGLRRGEKMEDLALAQGQEQRWRHR